MIKVKDVYVLIDGKVWGRFRRAIFLKRRKDRGILMNDGRQVRFSKKLKLWVIEPR